MQIAATTTSTAPRTAPWAIALLVGGLGVVVAVLSSVLGPTVLWLVAAAALAAIVWNYPRQSFLAMIPLLFLEHDAFSIELPIGRLRAYHVLIVVLLARLGWDVLRGTKQWRRTPLDVPLLAYLGLNAVAIAWSPDPSTAIKILGLELLLAGLYWLVVNELRTSSDVRRVVRWFITSAAVVAVLGLLQLAAVWLNDTYHVLLWAGPIIHSEILPYGRPYGTFVEPDWFGAMAMVALTVTAAYVLSRKHAARQLGSLALTLLFAAALVLSVVRGAWLGAIAALVTMLWINRRKKWLDVRILMPAAVGLLLALVLLALFAPDVVSAVIARVTSLGSWATVLNEPRYLVVQEGIDIWLRTPLSIWFGHGPGAFNVLGSIPFITPVQQIVQRLVPFQTNAIVNVLVDTGVIGLAVVSWLVVRLVKVIKQGMQHVSADVAVALLGLTGALVGLAITYQATTGLWLALSWFVIGLTVAVASIKKDAHAS